MTKAAALFFSLLSSSILTFAGVSAQAVVLPHGVFIAQQCGAQTIDVARAETHTMIAACVGLLNGTTTRAVQFRMSDDSIHTFTVLSQSNLMMALKSGNTMSIFRLADQQGQESSLQAIVRHDGTIAGLSGDFQGNSFLVPSLEQMMVIQ